MVEIYLDSISPVAFSLSKVGDIVLIKEKKPKLNEFRASIGPAVVSFLVFKNETKVGMIPLDFVGKFGSMLSNGKKARIIELNAKDKLIKIQFRLTKL